jgi:hypothetical protein
VQLILSPASSGHYAGQLKLEYCRSVVVRGQGSNGLILSTVNLSYVAKMILGSFVIDGKSFLNSQMDLDFYSTTRRALLTLNFQRRAAVEIDTVFFKKKRTWSWKNAENWAMSKADASPACGNTGWLGLQ